MPLTPFLLGSKLHVYIHSVYFVKCKNSKDYIIKRRANSVILLFCLIFQTRYVIKNIVICVYLVTRYLLTIFYVPHALLRIQLAVNKADRIQDSYSCGTGGLNVDIKHITYQGDKCQDTSVLRKQLLGSSPLIWGLAHVSLTT